MKNFIKKSISTVLITSGCLLGTAFAKDCPEWDSNTVYLDGKKVSYQGYEYTAKYWTRGNVPTESGPWGPWVEKTHYTVGQGTCGQLPPGETALITEVGKSVVLTDAQIVERWGAINPKYTSEGVANAVQELMSEEAFKRLFPRRYGSPIWDAFKQKDEAEYYTHQSLIDAVKDMANIQLKIETRKYATRVSRFDKVTKEETLLKVHKDYYSDWLKGLDPDVVAVDYGKFLNEGSLETRKRELAALLANIAHETTGGWATAPDGPYAWGLFFKEETACDDDTVGRYVQPFNQEYPPAAGESYHGRGPMQLSWNYNYGYMSQIVFKDKNILLNNPDQLAHDGKLGFMTGIWFWMTPQSPKPSNHDVMVGNWVPTTADILANRLPGFGVTINVTNGALECNKPGNSSVKDRIGFYKKIAAEYGVSTGDNLSCENQLPF